MLLKKNIEDKKVHNNSTKPAVNKLREGSTRVVLRASDPVVLDKTASDLVAILKKSGVSGVVGPVPLPKKRKVWTLLTSPHIDKKARQQLQRFVRTRIIDLPASKEAMEILDSNCSIPATVEIEIKT